jgi:hypothetical protein
MNYHANNSKATARALKQQKYQEPHGKAKAAETLATSGWLGIEGTPATAGIAGTPGVRNSSRRLTIS